MRHGRFARSRYFLAVIVSPQRYVRDELLKDRVVVGEHCINDTSSLHRNSYKKVRRLHSGNAREFSAMRRRLVQREIDLTTSSLYTPQSNGLAERINRTLLARTWSILKKAGMKPCYWGDVLSNAVYLYNRSSTPVLRMKTSHEMSSRKSPNNSKLWIIGWATFSHRGGVYRSGKFDDRADMGIFFGAREGLHRIYICKTKLVLTKIGIVRRRTSTPRWKRIWSLYFRTRSKFGRRLTSLVRKNILSTPWLCLGRWTILKRRRKTES